MSVIRASVVNTLNLNDSYEWLATQCRDYDDVDVEFELGELRDAAIANDGIWFDEALEDLSDALNVYGVRLEWT